MTSADITAPMPTGSRANAGGKPNGNRRPRAIAELDRRTLDKLDRRTIEYRRYEAIRGALIADLGGDDVVSTAEAQIADKAAFIAMTLEGMQIAALGREPIDLQRYGELTDRLRRNLEAIGLERRARDVTPTLAQVRPGHRGKPHQRRSHGEWRVIEMKPLVSLRAALTDANLLGDVLGGDSWAA